MCYSSFHVLKPHHIFMGFSQSSSGPVFMGIEKIKWSYLCPFYGQ